MTGQIELCVREIEKEKGQYNFKFNPEPWSSLELTGTAYDAAALLSEPCHSTHKSVCTVHVCKLCVILSLRGLTKSTSCIDWSVDFVPLLWFSSCFLFVSIITSFFSEHFKTLFFYRVCLLSIQQHPGTRNTKYFITALLLHIKVGRFHCAGFLSLSIQLYPPGPDSFIFVLFHLLMN